MLPDSQFDLLATYTVTFWFFAKRFRSEGRLLKPTRFPCLCQSLLRLQPQLDKPADPLAFSPINVNADSFVAGSQEDPAAVAAGGASQDLARWPDRP
jgi:hypothetical protein